MKEFNLIKKSTLLIKQNLKKISMLLLLIIGVSILVFDKNESYAIQFEGNMMNMFPDVIKNNGEKIYEVYFLDLSQEEINERYNKASIKADLTYNSTGKVYGWLEELETDKYKLIVASTGKTYLYTGYKLFGDYKVENSEYTFYFDNVEKIDFTNVDTSKVTDMSYMFYYCRSLTSLDLSNFDTSNVENMNFMFNKCSSLTSLNLSNFNTSSVTKMDAMFQQCCSLTSLDISNFDTKNVTAMDYMFYNCANLVSLNLSNFDTSNVEDMKYMFYNCKSLTGLDLSSFNTSKIINMENMLKNCDNLENLKLDVSNLSIVKNDILILKVMNLNIVLKKIFNFDNIYSSTDTLKTNNDVIITGDYGVDSNSNKYSIAILGDVNGDGKCNLSDIMKLANYVYKDKSSLTGAYLMAGDYNLDNSYNLQDIMKIANKVYKGGN